MSKRVTSVSLDNDVRRYIDQTTDLNTSALVNAMLRQYFEAGTSDALEYRLRELNREIESKRDQLDNLINERDRIAETIEDRDNELNAKLDEAIEQLSTIPPGMLDEDNPAVQKYASELNRPAREVIEEVKKQPGYGRPNLNSLGNAESD